MDALNLIPSGPSPHPSPDTMLSKEEEEISTPLRRQPTVDEFLARKKSPDFRQDSDPSVDDSDLSDSQAATVSCVSTDSPEDTQTSGNLRQIPRQQITEELKEGREAASSPPQVNENESSGANSAPSKPGPQTKCKECGELKSNDQFSKQQLKVPKKSKCSVCIQKAHPELAAAAAAQEKRSEQSAVSGGAAQRQRGKGKEQSQEEQDVNWIVSAGRQTRLCWGCERAEEVGSPKFNVCPTCAEEKLPSSHFCSEECLKLNWKRHKAWHKTVRVIQQEWHEAEDTIGFELEAVRKQAGGLKEGGKEFHKLVSDGSQKVRDKNFKGAIKILSKAVALQPNNPGALFLLTVAFHGVNDAAMEAETALKVMGLTPAGSVLWAKAVLRAYTALTIPPMRSYPKPEWITNKAELFLIAERVVVALPSHYAAWSMWGVVQISTSVSGAIACLKTAIALSPRERERVTLEHIVASLEKRAPPPTLNDIPGIKGFTVKRTSVPTPGSTQRA